MTLMRWDPFSELLSLRNAVDRLLEGGPRRPAGPLVPFGQAGAFPIDMYQTPTDVVVKASLPGVDPEDIEVSISENTLTIRGETKAEEEIDEGDYIYREHRYGSFVRSVALPSSVKGDKAEADFEHGALTITIPKSEEAKPKVIGVKRKGAVGKRKPQARGKVKEAAVAPKARTRRKARVRAKAKAEAKGEVKPTPESANVKPEKKE